MWCDDAGFVQSAEMLFLLLIVLLSLLGGGGYMAATLVDCWRGTGEFAREFCQDSLDTARFGARLPPRRLPGSAQLLPSPELIAVEQLAVHQPQLFP